MAKLKVYGGMDFVNGKQHRCVVSAPSKKRAVELLNESGIDISMHRFNNYWCESGNSTELELTQKHPETVLYALKHYAREYAFVETHKKVKF